jgi:hypothetical protein
VEEGGAGRAEEGRAARPGGGGGSGPAGWAEEGRALTAVAEGQFGSPPGLQALGRAHCSGSQKGLGHGMGNEQQP